MRAVQTKSYMGHGSPGLRCLRTSEKACRYTCDIYNVMQVFPVSRQGFSIDRHVLCSMPKESMPARQAKQLVLDMCQINANPRQAMSLLVATTIKYLRLYDKDRLQAVGSHDSMCGIGGRICR